MAHSQRVAAFAAFVLAAAGGLAMLSAPAIAGTAPSSQVTVTVPGTGISLTSTLNENGDVQNESVGTEEGSSEATVNGVEDGDADSVEFGQTGDNEGDNNDGDNGNTDDGTADNNDGDNGNTDDGTADDNEGDNGNTDDGTADDNEGDNGSNG